MHRKIFEAARSALLAATVSVVLAGCSDDAAQATGCTLKFAGDTAETATLPEGCASIASSGDAGTALYVLSVNTHTPEIVSLAISVPLGADPSPGEYTSDTLSGWSVTAAVAQDSGSGCTYAAGTDSVPAGNLNLTLKSASVHGAAHGTLQTTLYVHAPPYTDCGPSSEEQLALEF